jgi:hypothetical protein
LTGNKEAAEAAEAAARLADKMAAIEQEIQ